MSKSRSTSLMNRTIECDEAYDGEHEVRMKEDVQILTSSEDKRKRRHKQALRESQKFQREREGKKPFLLTMDDQGVPYGPGRPAWITAINKLAKWLDLSCIDIRKQTYGDICIFKERLSEQFEYTEDVNESYLRGLMGKAVTKKRTEVISFIKSGGSCPSVMDKKVWERLELLASSEQRIRRSEHGRFANSCRRTLGRTGASGEDGVRERLREKFGRSPDPNEVAHEMQRDKGRGKGRSQLSIENPLLLQKAVDYCLQEQNMML